MESRSSSSGNFSRPFTLKLRGPEEPVRMVQYAVAQKDGEWTVFRDGEPIEHDLTRSAAIQIARILAFESEERGHTVELLIQGYYGEVTTKVTGVPPLAGDEPAS